MAHSSSVTATSERTSQFDGPPIYPLLDATAAGFAAETILHWFGMSALAALFTALATLHDRVELLVPPAAMAKPGNCSVASVDASIPFRGVRTKPDGSPRALRALLLDSSLRGGRGFCPRAGRDIDLAIFDTTCYWRDSARIRRAMRWAARASIPLALVRSHAKLDCLGVEYGRLGSVVVAVPERLAASRSARLSEALAHETREAVRLLGAAPTPANFPPFAGAPQFSRCSAARIAAIIGNNRRMSRTLSRALGGPRVVGEFQHGLYLTLASEHDLSVNEASDAAASLCREAASSPARSHTPARSVRFPGDRMVCRSSSPSTMPGAARLRLRRAGRPDLGHHSLVAAPRACCSSSCRNRSALRRTCVNRPRVLELVLGQLAVLVLVGLGKGLVETFELGRLLLGHESAV